MILSQRDAEGFYDLPRANCRWCGMRIDTRDYWFWWLRRWHRICRFDYRESEPAWVATKRAIRLLSVAAQDLDVVVKPIRPRGVAFVRGNQEHGVDLEKIRHVFAESGDLGVLRLLSEGLRWVPNESDTPVNL